MEVNGFLWDVWLDEAISKLESIKVLRSLRPIHLPPTGIAPLSTSIEDSPSNRSQEFRVFDGPREWDRASVEVNISESTFQKWLHNAFSSGDDNDAIYEKVIADDKAEPTVEKLRKLIVFSGNDYLGLSSHPMVSNAASKAALEHGMGPRGSALICGYTSYHRLLESSVANLKGKEVTFSLTLYELLSIGNLQMFNGFTPLGFLKDVTLTLN